ncbi:MAG: hypothetical protein IJ301_01935 [Clostridia bacterium]|nr:hypothetical protein [Clostridia bacterium]
MYSRFKSEIIVNFLKENNLKFSQFCEQAKVNEQDLLGLMLQDFSVSFNVIRILKVLKMHSTDLFE